MFAPNEAAGTAEIDRNRPKALQRSPFVDENHPPQPLGRGSRHGIVYSNYMILHYM